MNPIDVKLQTRVIYPMPYSAILGEDVAGEVVQVGEDTPYAIGDRVIGLTAGFVTEQSTARGFQECGMPETNLSCKIPDSLLYEDAVVLPLAISTAAAGLFAKDFLNLRKPVIPVAETKGEFLVVWGGASSVGTAATQLARAAGYEVVATASQKNFDMVRKLGASIVVDYTKEDAASQVVKAVKRKKFVGVYDAVGGSAWKCCAEVAQQCEGDRFVVSGVTGFPESPEGVVMKPVFSLDIMKTDVGKAVWEEFMLQALRNGFVVPAPEPLIVRKGFENVQNRLDVLWKGVSAKKVVVTL